jgi:hypothetical protein
MGQLEQSARQLHPRLARVHLRASLQMTREQEGGFALKRMKRMWSIDEVSKEGQLQ